jgi:RNAse (barnase) inhibitor barstar
LLNLTELGVDVLIKKAKSKDLDSFWNNYSLVIWEKDQLGFTNNKGSFRNKWGIAEEFAINNDGLWKLPTKYVKIFK